ncbi:MAG: hypothetical protein HC802_13785 [Caldilineaceae bacterium]|nr:hypothetical protein [Caldilineaceae bacterium]
MSLTHARLLWQTTPHTVQALLDVGPDLVDTFLLGTPLLTRAKAAVSAQTGEMLGRLEALIARNQARQRTANLHQDNLFAQYSRVLRTVTERQPLLLIIDDLQWADVGSISLLFYLSRHLKGERILLVGIYRAAEVALGRGASRHPLTPLLNELQQTFGDIHVWLSQADGRRFVDAYVDSMPNRLDRAFRDALYRQTAGHPLFTAEIVHGLQARGDLIQDADGAWIVSSEVDWQILPARVEGLIKERIGLLSPVLQELLQIASVVGETFFAETVARILGVDEGQIVGHLGTTLTSQQRLVAAQGRHQVAGQQLSQYRFRHILFQQYLYNSLDETQRFYLHRAIAEELESCYGDQSRLIAPRLARHYAIAGEDARALHYYTVAGDMAAAIYANAEAEANYRRAWRWQVRCRIMRWRCSSTFRSTRDSAARWN